MPVPSSDVTKSAGSTVQALLPASAGAGTRSNGRRLILEESRIKALFGEETPVLRWYKGADLVGTRYQRPFELLPVPSSRETNSASTTV